MESLTTIALQYIPIVINNALLIGAVVVMALLTRQVLLLTGQTWAATLSHTLTLATLPVLTFTITKVISGNIALSLGMVGALSIVRFRNPVKSPLELTAYFACISYGIIGAANPKWLFIAGMGFAITSILTYAYKYIYEKISGKKFTVMSFSEGSEKSVLDIRAPIKNKSILLKEIAENEDVLYINTEGDYITISIAFDQIKYAIDRMNNIDSIVKNCEFSVR